MRLWLLSLPCPSFGFLRAVSHNRKRVHEASARLFRSWESSLVGNSEECLEPGSGGWGVRGLGVAPSGGRVPSSSPPPPTPPCPPLPRRCRGNRRQRFPSPREEHLSAAAFRSHQLHRRRPWPHGATRGVLTAWGSPRPVSVHAEAGRTCLGPCGSPWGRACPLGARAGGEQGLCGGLGGSGAVCSPCMRVCFLLYQGVFRGG